MFMHAEDHVRAGGILKKSMSNYIRHFYGIISGKRTSVMAILPRRWNRTIRLSLSMKRLCGVRVGIWNGFITAQREAQALILRVCCRTSSYCAPLVSYIGQRETLRPR